ncbi:MAG: NADPH-dependent F420 reductase [Candidatus Methanoperedens sp.]|nr:NADPH-dependent F420 reductase [Candidatus Methanoperedens sp.]
MKIAVLGGTGRIGEGLAYRWAPHHEIYVGSRDIEKARNAACGYACQLTDRDIDCRIDGTSNKEAVEKSDVVVLSTPYEASLELIECLRPILKNQIVISLVVPMKKNQWFEYTPPEEGCAALRIQRMLPGINVVSAYHNLSYKKLCNFDLVIKGDVAVCGDDSNSKSIVMDLTREIRSVRPLDGGPLRESRMIESLTPFLINMAIRNGLSDLGVKFV